MGSDVWPDGTAFPPTWPASPATWPLPDGSSGVWPARGTTPPSTGLKLWLKADAGVTQSGGKVSGWADQSGNGNNVSQATGANQPTFDSSVINGLPGIRFTGTAVSLASTASSLLAGSSARHIISAVKCGSTASPGGPIVVFRSTTPWFAAYLAKISANTFAYSDGVTVTSMLSAPPTLTSTAFEVEHACSGPGAGNLTLALNATSKALTTPNPVAETGAVGFEIGNAPSASQFFDGDICEVLVYDHVLSAPDLTQVRSYMSSRYGLF